MCDNSECGFLIDAFDTTQQTQAHALRPEGRVCGIAFAHHASFERYGNGSPRLGDRRQALLYMGTTC